MQLLKKTQSYETAVQPDPTSNDMTWRLKPNTPKLNVPSSSSETRFRDPQYVTKLIPQVNESNYNNGKKQFWSHMFLLCYLVTTERNKCLYVQVHTVTTADKKILRPYKRLQLQLIIELDELRILQITQQN